MNKNSIYVLKEKVSICALIMSKILEEERRSRLKDAYTELDNTFKEYRKRVIPNNKLKMNGEPMRRKGGIRNGKRKYRNEEA